MELPGVEERDEMEYQKSVDCAIQLINEKINDLLLDVQPADQFSIDCSMRSAFETLRYTQPRYNTDVCSVIMRFQCRCFICVCFLCVVEQQCFSFGFVEPLSVSCLK